MTLVRRPPVRGTYGRSARVQHAMDRLADHVADGGTIPAFDRAEGISPSRAHQLWQEMRADLGSQAI